MTRQIVLDTETTGLEPEQGHRIIEIGCVEMLDRKLTGNNFHQYLQPDREIDAAAIEVHGIDNEFLADKPRFADISKDFIEYVQGAALIIHNARFDLGFLKHEMRRLDSESPTLESVCDITDTLVLARKKHPGQRNSLDALCRRYDIDNTHRELHGALLDAEILADVYLAMTGGQTSLSLESLSEMDLGHSGFNIRRLPRERPRLRVVHADEEALQAHRERLTAIAEASGGKCLWANDRPEGDRERE